MVYKSSRNFNLNLIWTLIALCAIVTIATLVNRDLIYLLGLNRASFLDRPWTIISNLFVHAGLWHLIFNMIALYFFGSYVGRLVGESRLLLVYFGGGILGNILYLLLGSPFIPAVGASGAIFALGGALAMLRPKLPVLVFPLPVPIPLWIAVIGSFVILSFIPSVAWQAHLGGLIVGLVAGYFFRRRERRYYL
jgi:membrane associated rhomboid family serine protease